MRSIDIDIDVFSAIWAARRPPEVSENEILRRILGIGGLGGGVPAGTPDIDLSVQSGFATDESKKELKNSKTGNESVGKMRWVDDVVVALRSLGGCASLHSIYKEVRKQRKEEGRSTPPTFDAIVRRTLEDHSSDSANFRGTDLFELVGRGEWALRL